MTYNIERGGRGRADTIARVIQSCAPDVVLLQEATDPETIERIRTATGMAEGQASRQSLGYLSRAPALHVEWTRPLLSRHAFVEVIAGGAVPRLFGVHLSALHAAWTERRRVMEIRALLKSVREHQHGFHVLAGDFNTLAPDEPLDLSRLPPRLRPFVWLSGGSIRWQTIQLVLDAGYVDVFRSLHPKDDGTTLPTGNPHVRLDYVFVPRAYADRVVACDVVRHPDAVAASDHYPLVADLRVD